jgi:hypothetical protein
MSWNITGAPGTGEDLLYSQAGTPTLDLRFASSKNLNDYVSGQNLIDFTRGGNGIGSYFDAAGTLRQSVVNLLLRSEEFDEAYWIKTNSTIVQNAIASPDGRITAAKLNANTTNGIHAVRRDETVLSSTNYTVSFFAKAGEYSFVAVNHGHTLVADFHTFFNLSTGTVATNAAGNTPEIEALGNGWYRCTVTRTTASNQTSLSARALACQSDNVTSFVGDASSGIYLWGAQLEQSSTVGEYVKTTSSISGAPRFDHNPATGESLGLLIEEARTNLLLNSETLATQSVTVTAAAHTLSFYGTGTVTLSGTHSATVVGTGAFPTRTTLTFTPTSGSLTVTVSGTVQYAQVELGAFATSWISTAGATATRNADVAQITGTNFSRWYSQSAGTLFADVTPRAGGGFFGVDNATNNERLRIGHTGGTGVALIVVAGNSVQANVSTPSNSSILGNRVRAAGAYALNDFTSCAGGSLSENPDTSGVLPVVTQATIGVAQATSYTNSHISRLAYFDRRLPNATLQAITA